MRRSEAKVAKKKADFFSTTSTVFANNSTFAFHALAPCLRALLLSLQNAAAHWLYSRGHWSVNLALITGVYRKRCEARKYLFCLFIFK